MAGDGRARLRHRVWPPDVDELTVTYSAAHGFQAGRPSSLHNSIINNQQLLRMKAPWWVSEVLSLSFRLASGQTSGVLAQG